VVLDRHRRTSAGAVIRTYERLRSALKKHPAVEAFSDGSVKVGYDENTLDEIVSGDLYTKIDFHSLAIDLAFLRDLSAAHTKGGPRAAQHRVAHCRWPATNYSLAVAAHNQYAGSRLLTVTREGDHGVYGGVNKCADKIVNTFLTTGTAPAKDVSCVGEGIPAPSAPAPELEDGGELRYAEGAPLRRVAGFTKAVSGYLH
jgi:hypothetical protein